MPERFVEEAVERARACRAVVEKHRGELLPHFLVLIKAIGEISARACVYGAFEASVDVSKGHHEEPGDGALLDVIARHERSTPSEGSQS